MCVFLSGMASNAPSEIVEVNDSNENIDVQADDNEQSVSVAANNNSLSRETAESENVDANEESESAAVVVSDDMPFEFTVGLTLNSKLIYTTVEKQLYRRDKKVGENGSCYYRCNIASCKAGLFYDAIQNKCSRKKLTPHTHPDQEKTMKVGKLRKIIKDECAQMAGSSKRNKSSVSEVIYTNIRQ